jgi:hypothetical protein
MSKKYFKQVKKDLEWGSELSRDPPKLGVDGVIDDGITDVICDVIAHITIKSTNTAAIEQQPVTTYNGKISEFTKQLASSRPELIPKERIKLAREMYKEWKSIH